MIDPTQEEAMLRNSADSDEYRLKSLDFIPDVFYDIGANVGGVTILAASLFPDTIIVAVEPEEENYRALVKNTKHLSNVTTVNAALTAENKVYRCPTSPGIGNWIFNSESSPTFVQDWVVSDVPGISLDQLLLEHGGEKPAIKLDCESGEMMVITHHPSRKASFKFEYLAGEFHLWGSTHSILQELMRKFLWWIYQMSMTHDVDVEFRGGMAMVYATKRAVPDGENSWEHVLKLQEKDV